MERRRGRRRRRERERDCFFFQSLPKKSKKKKKQVSVFLPQLVQLLRADDGGQIRAYLLAAASRSVLYAHMLICTLSAEGTPPPEAFSSPAVKRSGWSPPENTGGLWAVADELKAAVWRAMPPEKLDRLRAEVAFFDAVTGVSGRLYPVPKEERKNEAVRFVREVGAPPRGDLYLPTEPRSRLVRAVPESASPMQSAAKVPILVAFEVEKEVVGEGGGDGGEEEDEDEEEDEEEEDGGAVIEEEDGDEEEETDGGVEDVGAPATSSSSSPSALSAPKKPRRPSTNSNNIKKESSKKTKTIRTTTAARTSSRCRSSACSRTRCARPASTYSWRPTA